MGIGAANRVTYWCLVLLLADWISQREDAVVYRVSRDNLDENGASIWVRRGGERKDN